MDILFYINFNCTVRRKSHWQRTESVDSYCTNTDCVNDLSPDRLIQTEFSLYTKFTITRLVLIDFSRYSSCKIWAKWTELRTTYSTSICRTLWDSKTPRIDCKRSLTITSGVFEVSRWKINQIRARDLHKRDPSSRLTVTRIEKKRDSEMINIIQWLPIGFILLYLL